MIDKLDSSLRFQQEALQLRALRQDVLAANIAHADTPNFKARDIDFAASLTQALERGRPAATAALASTSSRHLGASAQAAGAAALMYRAPTQSSIDGNTVDMDVERVNFADNALRYEMNLTVVSAKIKAMLAAVQS